MAHISNPQLTICIWVGDCHQCTSGDNPQVCIAAYVIVAALLMSRFGRVALARAVKVQEQRASSLSDKLRTQVANDECNYVS